MHADQASFVAYGGTITRDLEGFAVTPEVDVDAAIERAVEHLAAAPGALVADAARPTGRLAIRPWDGGGAELVWAIEIDHWFYLVDAAGGSVRAAWDRRPTLEQASGPGGNPRAPRHWTAALDVEPRDGSYAMDPARITTLDGAHTTSLFGDVVTGPLEAMGDAAANDAHGFTEVTLDMMSRWMGLDSLDGNGVPILNLVHYGNGVGNAFYYGGAVYGDGDGFATWPLSGALDVVAHELGHGFTGYHSMLDYIGMSGGLNESFSDVVGTVAEFFHEGEAADFLLGEDIMRLMPAMRYMCEPPRDQLSIDHASRFLPPISIRGVLVPVTDVHHSSGIGNKAFCLAVGRVTAAGAEPVAAVRSMGQVWFLANAGYWNPETSFSQGCQGTIDAARALGRDAATITSIHQSWADVGVFCESGEGLACNADGRCDVAEGETCMSCATDCGACIEECGAWKQARCLLGIGGDCRTCRFTAACGDGVCDGDESDDSCGQDCGCRAPGDACGMVAPFGCWCDAACSESGDCCADAEVCR